MSGPTSRTVTARALAPILHRPDLWSTALRAGRSVVPHGWWRRWPPVPRPPRAYEEFRRQTMFGSAPGATLTGGELVDYLEWCKRMQGLR